MFPSFTLFGKTIGLYALLAIVGGMLVGVIHCRRTAKRGLNDNDAIVCMLWVAVGVLIGGHLLYALTNLRFLPRIFEASSLSELLRGLELVFGGAVFYGGLFGGLLAGVLYARWKKLPMPFYADSLASLIPLFHSIARVGCFLGGCCYGVESSFGFVVHDNPYLPELNGVRRFPVQLLESFGNLLLFLLLDFLFRRIWPLDEKKAEDGGKSGPYLRLRGLLLPLYFSLYAILRFFDEFLRGDAIRGFLFGGTLSTSQFISILLETAGLLWLFLSLKKRSQKSGASK